MAPKDPQCQNESVTGEAISIAVDCIALIIVLITGYKTTLHLIARKELNWMIKSSFYISFGAACIILSAVIAEAMICVFSPDLQAARSCVYFMIFGYLTLSLSHSCAVLIVVVYGHFKVPL